MLSVYNPVNEAYVCSKPLDHNMWDPLSLVDAGNVSLNGVVFDKYLGVPYEYEDTSATKPPGYTLAWAASGSASIPAFTFIDTNTYPVFNGYSAVPDSFQVSLGATIPLPNYSNADEIMVIFRNSQGAATSIKYFAGNATSIQFTASELAPIGPSRSVSLYLTFYKNNNQVINGNNYVFRTGYTLRKTEIKFK